MRDDTESPYTKSLLMEVAAIAHSWPLCKALYYISSKVLVIVSAFDIRGSQDSKSEIVCAQVNRGHICIQISLAPKSSFLSLRCRTSPGEMRLANQNQNTALQEVISGPEPYTGRSRWECQAGGVFLFVVLQPIPFAVYREQVASYIHAFLPVLPGALQLLGGKGH